jgi:hypothetical protein
MLWVKKVPPHSKPHPLVGFPYEEKIMGPAGENVKV